MQIKVNKVSTPLAKGDVVVSPISGEYFLISCTENFKVVFLKSGACFSLSQDDFNKLKKVKAVLTVEV